MYIATNTYAVWDSMTIAHPEKSQMQITQPSEDVNETSRIGKEIEDAAIRTQHK